MSLEFRIDSKVGPSGVNLAHVNIPRLSPKQNMSIIDKSYRWEENVGNIDSGEISTYVGEDGLLPSMTITDFVVTNVATDGTSDMSSAPLYYSHTCRFYHYSYGANPAKQVYITDQKNNVLKGINYKVWSRRLGQNLFQVQVLTDFQNNEYVQYKVKYNRTDENAETIFPSWTETLNAQPLFNEGAPSVNMYEYALLGPDANGLYRVDVPPVPTLTPISNSIGVSFELAPTFIEGYPPSIETHTADVTYTIKAIGTTTFTIERNNTPTGGATADVYLQSLTGNTWGALAVGMTIGNTALFDGTSVFVGGDSYLNTNDEAFFVASKSYYYLKPIKFRAIYLEKPTNVTPDDDWYLKIKAGSFTRRMDGNGDVVPSGQGTRYQYYIPEYDENPWSLEYGRPNIGITNEKPSILDSNTIKVKHVPLFIEPSDVFYNEGFPPSGFLSVHLNDEQISEDSIVDWDVNNGTIRIAQTLGVVDDIKVSYNYSEEYYEYQGFYGSGKLYPDTGPFEWFPLEVNPTPMHNYEMYASGVTAYVFLSPSWDLDKEIFFDSNPCYHNYTGDPSGSLDFCLGSISLAPHAKPTDVKIIDTRSRGGGLRSDVDLDAVKRVQPESEFYWDVGYFDGKAFPSNGVLVVEVPRAFENREDEIREKINRHIAYGEYCIIDFV